VKSLYRILSVCALLLFSSTVFAASEEAVNLNHAGTVLFQQGKIDSAINVFQKALGVDPNYHDARLNLAYAYERTGKIDDAIAAYREAVSAQPNNFLARNNLGVLYDKKGMYDSAIAEFQSALQTNSGDSMALKNLETAKKNKAAAQEREAQILQLEKRVKAKPNDAHASYDLARTYAIYGKKELAYDWLGKALKQGYKDLDYVRSDPAFKGMREERDFRLLLELSTR
jgi:tetratricopeptide (TPR) repeat protein